MSDSTADRRAPLEVLKQIPPLMPVFLAKRRAGLAAVRELADQLGVDRQQFFFLVEVGLVQGSYGGASIAPGQLWAYDPYNAIDRYTEPLVLLKDKRLIVEERDGQIGLSSAAAEAVQQLHEAGSKHVESLRPLPVPELEELAAQLERAVRALMADPELVPRPGSHLAGSSSLALHGEQKPMVRIEQAVLDLWAARDDAHVRAWRSAGLEGPPTAVLTALWSGRAHNLGELYEMLGSEQTVGDLDSSMSFLAARDFVTRDGDDILLTPAGVLVREDVERETDRIYFDPWPHSEREAIWVRDHLSEVVDRLPAPAQPLPRTAHE